MLHKILQDASKHTNMPIILALAGAGVAGHLGTRSLMMLRDKYGLKDYE